MDAVNPISYKQLSEMIVGVDDRINWEFQMSEDMAKHLAEFINMTTRPSPMSLHYEEPTRWDRYWNTRRFQWYSEVEMRDLKRQAAYERKKVTAIDVRKGISSLYGYRIRWVEGDNTFKLVKRDR